MRTSPVIGKNLEGFQGDSALTCVGRCTDGRIKMALESSMRAFWRHMLHKFRSGKRRPSPAPASAKVLWVPDNSGSAAELGTRSGLRCLPNKTHSLPDIRYTSFSRRQGTGCKMPRAMRI